MAFLQFIVIFLCIGGSHLAGSNPADYRRQRSTDKLRVVTIQVEPYVRFRWEPGLLGNERYEGYYVDLLQRIAERAGFTYQLQLAGDGKVGSWNREDGWNGMLGELARGTADFALGPIAMTPERTELFNFTTRIADAHLSYLVRMDTATSLQMTSFSDLLDQRDFTYGTIRGSDCENIARASSDATIQRVWAKIQENSAEWKSHNMFEALDRIRRTDTNYALVVESDLARFYISKRPCDLAMIDIKPTGVGLGFGVRNGTAGYLGAVNGVIDEVRRNSVDWGRSMRSRWWRRECSGATDSREEEETQVTDGSTLSTLPVEQPRRHLTIAAVLEEPYFMASRTPGKRWEGYIVDLVARMADTVPFDYDWLIENSVGKYRNGRWNGVIKELLQENADFAAIPFQITNKGSQSRVLDYTKPFLHSDFSVLLKSGHSRTSMDYYMMDDLLNNTQLHFGVVKGTRIERELKRAKDPLLQQVWRRITNETQVVTRRTRHSKTRSSRNIVRTLEKGVEKVRDGNFALLVESTEAAYISSKLPCDLNSYDQFLSVANYGFALKKGSTLVYDLDTAFLHLQQDSVLQSIFHRWFFNEGECERDMFTEELPFIHVKPNVELAPANAATPTISPTTTSTLPTSTLTSSTSAITTTTRRPRQRPPRTTARPTTTLRPSTTTIIHTTTHSDSDQDQYEFSGPIRNKDIVTQFPLTSSQRPQIRNVDTSQRPRDDSKYSNKDRDKVSESPSIDWFFHTEVPKTEDNVQEDTYDHNSYNTLHNHSNNSSPVVLESQVLNSSSPLHLMCTSVYFVLLLVFVFQ